MSSLRSAGFDQAGNASGTLRIVASAMSGAGVRSRSGCPTTRAEAAHARMLEALRGDAWVRARLRDSGFDAARCTCDRRTALRVQIARCTRRERLSASGQLCFPVQVMQARDEMMLHSRPGYMLQSSAEPLARRQLRHDTDAVSEPLLRRSGLSGPMRSRIEALMHERMSESLRLVDLAAAAGISRCYFSRLFHSSFGQPPHQYLLELRLQRARSLLEARQRPIADVAAMTGFSDQSHLTRCFRRRFGTTPSAICRH